MGSESVGSPRLSNLNGDDAGDGFEDTIQPSSPKAADPASPDDGTGDTLHPSNPSDPGDEGTLRPSGDKPPSDAPVSLAPGEKVGRYVLLEELGVGGMGVVYTAYDPELDRRVALKLLRTAGHEEARARLYREAQTLAKLAHPNVVGVHDVGFQGGEVFVAMEFVPGRTLRSLFSEEKSWERRLVALEGAGRGLVAAHELGIVHRDFKPDNVLVAKNGLSRVLDFGLARAAGSEPVVDPTIPAEIRASSANSVPTVNSMIGSVSGTPGYMAPEQYLGQPSDPRTDQFAFGVCLYEALYGERPFRGSTLRELAQAASRGVPEQPPPSAKDIPAWLWPLVRKALAPAPADRFASLEELLAAIAPRTKRKTAPLIAAAAVVAALSVVGGLMGKAQLEARSVCDSAGVPEEWARASLASRFTSSTLPYAADVWASTSSVLDGYSTSLSSENARACRAARIEKRDSDALYDARRLCLARRRSAFLALVEVLQTGGDSVIARAPEAAGKLPLVSDCADEVKVLSAVAEPTPSQLQAVTTLRAALARAQALEATGLYADGVALLRAQQPLAESTGHRPTLAALLVLLGSLERQAGDPKVAEVTQKRAMAEALGSNDREAMANACMGLAQTIGDALGRPAEGMPYTTWAQGTLDSLPSSEVLQAMKDNVTANLHFTAGEAAEAEQAFRHAYELRKKKLGERHLETGIALAGIGLALFQQSKVDESIEMFERALSIYLEVLGPNHPRVASLHNNLAIAVGTKGDLKKELEHQQKALEIREKTLGPEHPDIATSLANLAAVLSPLERDEEALAASERALGIRTKALGADHYLTANSLSSSAAFLRRLGRLPEALERSTSAVAVLRKTEADPSYLADALVNQGSILRQLGRSADAVPVLEESVKILEGMAEDVEESDLASARLQLALALQKNKGPKLRMTSLAQQAKTVFEKAADAHKSELSELDALLKP
jgi:serine/threonine-protein kinase